nr:hypothetical protein [Tanacetum cinerariifolium]
MAQAPEEIGEGLANPTDPYHTATIIQPLTSQPQRKQKSKKIKRKVIKVPQPSDLTTNVVDKAVNEEMDDSLERATTTTTSLDAEQDRGVNTPRSGEDSLKVNELMEPCTKLQQRVLDLESTKTTQALEINRLKMRVKKLKRIRRSRTYGLKRLYKIGLLAKVESSKDEGLGEVDASKQGRISDINANEDENVVEKKVDAAQIQVTTIATTPTILIDEATLAQALTELKHTKPKAKAKAKGIIFQKLEESTTKTTPIIPKLKSHDKGKAKIIEEPTKLKQKDQIQLDEEVALKAFKRANTFVDYRTELVDESSKKAEAEVTEGEEGVVIDSIPLIVKPPSIIDWKIQKEGKKTYYKIIRANGSLKIYLVFNHMLKDFDREDVETQWKLVKAKYGSTRPEGDYERVLWDDLEVMSELHR